MIVDPRRKGPLQHWVGDDGKVNEITYQGRFLKYRVHTPPSAIQIGGTKKPVCQFSRQSRLNLLSFFNKMDWTNAAPGIFITLTYPDEVECRKRKLLNLHRHVFWRHVEKHVGRHVPAVWRLEWLPRLSGDKIGEPMPHFHLLVFGVEFIHRSRVNAWWNSTLGHEGYVRTETKRMKNDRQAGYYLSKYLAKVHSSLVITAYLSKIPTGRQWGILRKSIVPMCEKYNVRLENGPFADELRELAALERPQVNAYGTASFTLLGDKAEAVGRVLIEKGVARKTRRK